MRKGIRRLAAFLCCFCVLALSMTGSADAFHVTDLFSADVTGPLDVTVSSPQVTTFAPYDANRVDQLNRLLQHLAMEIRIDETGSMVRLLADGTEALSFRGAKDHELSGLAAASGSVLPAESGETDAEDETIRFLSGVFEPFNILLNHLYPVFLRIPEAFPQQTKDMEASLSLSGYGRGVKKRVITIPAETAETSFRETLCSLCGTGEAREFLASLDFSGQQKISLMLDKDDRVIRITYDGRAGKSSEDLRTVSLVWKCLRDGNRRMDGLTLKTPAVKGTDRLNVTMERNLNPDGAAPAWTWSVDADEKTGQDRTLSKLSMEWTQGESGLAGKMNLSTNRNGEKTSFTADALFRPEESASFAGGLEITRKKGKIEKERYSVQVSLFPGEAPAAAEISGEATPDGEDGAEQTAENAQRKLLKALMRLPDDDLVFLFYGLPEEEWKTLVSGTVPVADE